MTYYGVEEKYYENREVSCKIIGLEAENMPDDTMQEIQVNGQGGVEVIERWVHWFTTEDDAIEYSDNVDWL